MANHYWLIKIREVVIRYHIWKLASHNSKWRILVDFTQDKALCRWFHDRCKCESETREELLKWYIKQYSLCQKFVFSYKPALNRSNNCLEAASWWSLSFINWWRIVALGCNLPKQGITFLTSNLNKIIGLLYYYCNWRYFINSAGNLPITF